MNGAALMMDEGQLHDELSEVSEPAALTMPSTILYDSTKPFDAIPDCVDRGCPLCGAAPICLVVKQIRRLGTMVYLGGVKPDC